MDFERSSRTDLYLDSTAWLIAGLALSVVVAQAVFRPGRITYHRVVGAVLLYLVFGLTFVALYGFVALAAPDVPIPGEAARHSGMKPPTDSEMISPTVPR